MFCGENNGCQLLIDLGKAFLIKTVSIKTHSKSFVLFYVIFNNYEPLGMAAPSGKIHQPRKYLYYNSFAESYLKYV